MTASVLQERQSSSGNASVTSIALAFSSTVTASSSLETYASSGTANTHTCADSSNGSHTSLEQTTANAVGTFSHFNKDNSAAATITVTVSFASDTFPSIWIKEIGGTSGLDGTAHGLTNAASGGGTTRSGPSLTPSVQPGLISALLYSDLSSSGAAGAGFTASNPVSGWNFGGATSNSAFGESKRYTSTVALAASFQSIVNTDVTVIAAALYKETAAASVPFIPKDLDERVTTKVLASDFFAPNLLADQILKLPPFVQKEFPTQAPRARGVFTDFNPANLLADQVLKPPPITQKELPGWALQAKGNYTDFAPPNLLADQALRLPPFTQRELPGVMLPARGITDFIHPNLIESTLLPAPRPLTPVDLSQQVKFRWASTDFNAPNLSFMLPVITTPVAPQDLSFTFNARWVGSDFITQNLLTGHLPAPPIAPIDATISIRAKGVFTDFSPPNLTLSTLVPPAALHPVDTATLRLEYRWIRGDDLPLNLLPLKLQTVNPIAPQDLSGMRLDAPALRSDFVPPNLTLTLPVPPPPPVSSAAGRHGTRRQARRRRELDVLRARIEAFKEQRADADRALMAAEDREVKARSQILKRVRVHRQELRKPLEQYAPVKKALAQRAVATDRYRSILGQIRAHQLEADRIQREIESEAADEQAALHLMHYLMMEIPWDV